MDLFSLSELCPDQINPLRYSFPSEHLNLFANWKELKICMAEDANERALNKIINEKKKERTSVRGTLKTTFILGRVWCPLLWRTCVTQASSARLAASRRCVQFGTEP